MYSLSDIEEIREDDDPRYPAQLVGIPGAPTSLYCVGNLGLLNLYSVAVVGTREPSEVGMRVTRRIVRTIAESDSPYPIVSGLARGIDSIAHRTALECQLQTIAVLVDVHPDHIYPHEHTSLAYRIVSSGGLLVSEHAPGASRRFPPKGQRGSFGSQLMARDRIQCGLAFATIPVQAGIGSGTLHTIQSTRAQGHGRVVMAPMPYQKDVFVAGEKYSGLYAEVRHEEFFDVMQSEEWLQRLMEARLKTHQPSFAL